MDRQRGYKRTRVPFTSEVSRFKRAEKNEIRRREQREKNIAHLREIQLDEQSLDETFTVEETTNDRMAKLTKWKEEKALQKKREAKNKKPVFKIGVPHHNFYSPTMNDPAKTKHCHRKLKNENVGPTETKKITRATERRLARKAAASATSGLSATTSESGKTPIARCTRARKKAAAAAVTTAVEAEIPVLKSFAPENHLFTKPTGINPMPLFGQIIIPFEPETPKETNHNFKFTFASPSHKNKHVKSHNVTSSKVKKISKRKSKQSIGTNGKISTKNDKKVEAIEIIDNNMENKDAEMADTSVESVILRVSSQESLDSNENKEDTCKIQNPKLKNKILEIQDKSESPVAALFSPFVVASRGKSSARKEIKKRMSLRTSCSPIDADIPTKDTVMKSLNISIEEEEHTAQYYRSLGQREEDRLKDLCIEWRKIQFSPDTPEDAIHHINSAIGQADLLINKKFGRFQQLVDNCEDGKGEMLVRCRDLQGFWELVSREVADCDSRFLKLKKLEANNWIEEEEENMPEKKPVVKKKGVVKKKINTAKSNMKSFIEAQRKKKLQEQMEIDAENNENVEDNKIQLKNSPIKTPKKNLVISSRLTGLASPKLTPKSIIRKQLSDSAKKMALASMKITQICKTPEVQLDQSISYINSHQTPGRGILKRFNDEMSKSLIKSTFKVNFNDTIDIKETPNDGDVDPNDSFVASLEKIDLTDLTEKTNEKDEQIVLNKKLNFDDSIISLNSDCEEFFTSPKNKKPTKKNNSIINNDNNEMVENETTLEILKPTFPSIAITPATPVVQRSVPILNVIDATPMKKTPRKRKDKQQDNTETPRQLTRNRSSKHNASLNESITIKHSCNSPHLNSPTDKENSVQKKKTIRMSAKKVLEADTGNISINIPTTPRKSNRLSMKQITEEGCAACSVILPATPMTPRRRRIKIESAQ